MMSLHLDKDATKHAGVGKYTQLYNTEYYNVNI